MDPEYMAVGPPATEEINTTLLLLLLLLLPPPSAPLSSAPLLRRGWASWVMWKALVLFYSRLAWSKSK
jgi:hypothetical protein